MRPPVRLTASLLARLVLLFTLIFGSLAESVLAAGLTLPSSSILSRDSVLDAPEPSAANQPGGDENAIPTVDLTSTPDDLWDRIRNGFAMPNLVSDTVTSQQVWFLNHPDSLRRTFERSRRYMHYIVEQLEKRGMPTELALLPMVESAYNPMAYSPARASGIWQFIPSTGRNFGLKQDSWQDERRDIVASTNAALDYLQTLYEMQGDWHLALASYNWGEGAVARAMNKNKAAGKPVDYLSLTMPNETRTYVPRLQALKNIIAQPALFKIKLDPIPNRPYFRTVKKLEDMDLATAARLAETPMEEFRALNPSHNRLVLRASSGASLVLPADKVETFLSNYESRDKSEKPQAWQPYTLQSRESLEQVAARFGTTVAQLRMMNGLTPRSHLSPGQSLVVPAREGTALTDQTVSQFAAPVEAPRVRKEEKKRPETVIQVEKRWVKDRHGRKHLVITKHRVPKAQDDDDDEEDDKPVSKAKSAKSAKVAKAGKSRARDEEDDDEEDVKPVKKAKADKSAKSAKASKGAKSRARDDDDDDEEDDTPVKSKAKAGKNAKSSKAVKAAKASKSRARDDDDDDEDEKPVKKGKGKAAKGGKTDKSAKKPGKDAAKGKSDKKKH